MRSRWPATRWAVPLLVVLVWTADARDAEAGLDVAFRTGQATADGAVLFSIGDVIGRDRTDIAFRGASSAIVARTAAGLTVIAKSGDPLPSPLTGTFDDLQSPAINANGLIV